MTLPNTDIYEEFTVLAGQTSFTLGSNVGYIPQDVDESLKVFIREDARTVVPTNIDITTNQINIPNHAFSVSLQVKVVFTTDNTAPNPLSSGSEYFAQYVDKDNITLSLTSGGAAIDLTSQGVGNHTITTLDPNGIELALNTDFTVTKVNQLPTEINFPTREGVDGQKLFVVRQSSVSQDDVDYTYATSWKPVEYETHVDKIYAILQEQGNKLSRAMLTRIGDTSSSNLVFPVPQDNSVIGWYEIGSGNFAFRNYDISIYVTDEELANAQSSIQANIDANSGRIDLNVSAINASVAVIDIHTTQIQELQDVANTRGGIALTNDAAINGPVILESCVIHFEMKRQYLTITENITRSAFGTLKVQVVDGTYYVSDPEYFIPIPTHDPPGLTFSFSGTTLIVNTDDMVGAGDPNDHSGYLNYTIIQV